MQMEIEKITSIIPEAEISQTGETVVKVPAEKLHQIAETLMTKKIPWISCATSWEWTGVKKA